MKALEEKRTEYELLRDRRQNRVQDQYKRNDLWPIQDNAEHLGTVVKIDKDDHGDTGQYPAHQNGLHVFPCKLIKPPHMVQKFPVREIKHREAVYRRGPQEIEHEEAVLPENDDTREYNAQK